MLRIQACVIFRNFEDSLWERLFTFNLLPGQPPPFAEGKSGNYISFL